MGILKNVAGLLALAAVLVTGPLAHAVTAAPAVAPVVHVSATDASGPVPGQASPTLTFSFVEPYDFTSLFLKIDYDPLKLSFNDALSSAVFHPSALPAFTLDDLVAASDGDFSYSSDETVAGSYTLTAFFANQSHVLPAGSSLVLTGVFDLVGLPIGQSTPVAMSGILTSTVADSDPGAVNDFAVGASVTAVPEPETWLMLLGGLAVLASRMRRRTR